MELLGSINKFPGLPPSARETAILALGSEYNSQYMIYSHECIAANHNTQTAGQIQEINAGKKPVGLSDAESVAYDVVMEFAESYEAVESEDVGTRGRGARERGEVALVHFVGYYSYVAVFLNGFDVPLPEGVRVI